MKFFIGLLLGLGLGVLVGLLVAPQSGEATRAMLTEQLNEQGLKINPDVFGDDLRTRANEALIQGRELYARTKDELTQRYNQARQGNL